MKFYATASYRGGSSQIMLLEFGSRRDRDNFLKRSPGISPELATSKDCDDVAAWIRPAGMTSWHLAGVERYGYFGVLR